MLKSKFFNVVCGTVLISLFVFCSLSIGNDKKKAREISENIDGFCMQTEVFTIKLLNGGVIKRTEKMDLLVGDDDYPILWEKHYAEITPIKKINGYQLCLTIRNYKHLTTAGAQFIQYVFKDYDADGTVDKWLKDYKLLQPRGENDKHFMYRYSPSYPDGFVNKKWYEMSFDEAQSMYKEEIDYWFMLIGKNI